VAWPSLYLADEIKEEDFGGLCSMSKRDAFKFLIRKPEGKKRL
jgi:hypothetical protein